MAFKLREPTLGVVACGGTMPAAIADAAIAQGRRVHIVALKGQTDPDIARFPHDWVRLGELGHLISSLRKAGCEDVVIIGTLRRPNIWKSGLDFGFFRHLPTILSLTRGGDDRVLTRVADFFERQGFRVRGAHEIAPSLLAPMGVLGSVRPDEEAESDIARGFALLKALSPFDVGQTVVVARGHVLAVEAAEGTDAMLKRCGELRQWGRSGRVGALVKAPKLGQDMRMDMPVVGPRTVEAAAGVGLAGIAVGAGQVMIAEQAEMIELADRCGVFVVGASTGASRT